jgi:hypothetical protein
MIWESMYWKKPLLETSSRLSKATYKRGLSDDALGRIEYDIMTGFFAIRKLIDAKTKVSTELSKKSILIKRWTYRPELNRDEFDGPNLVNWYQIRRFYDKESEHNASIALYQVCNQIIHSFVFSFSFDALDRIDGIAFSSDKDRFSHLNLLPIKDVGSVFSDFGNSYPSYIKYRRDKNGNFKISATEQ